MTSALMQFVIDKVWCTPGQDQELILTPKRLHGTSSIFQVLKYLDREIDLPNRSKSWFVYQIGTYYESQEQLPLGSPAKKQWEEEIWQPLSKPLTEDNVFTTLFTSKGIVFPLFRSFYMYTREKALLVAIENNSLINADLTTENLYVSFYINAFYNSSRSQGSVDYSLKTEGMILSAASDINAINTTIATLTATTGYCWLTINGKRYKKPTENFVSAGDYVEYIYDPTVEKVDSYQLSEMLSYNSALDGEEKRLFHSNLTNYFTSISFQDDVVIDLLTPISDIGYFGTIYPVSDMKDIRMLTHRDYGLRQSVIETLSETITDLNPSAVATNIIVEFKFRKSGYQRPIYNSTSLVEDLYTFPIAQIPALLTATATFDQFSASWMESSPYIEAMRAEEKEDITDNSSLEALGYNSVAKIYGHSATKVTISGSIKSIPIPTNYQTGCTAYEYNISGQLLEFHTSTGSGTYVATHLNCNMVELIKGIISNYPAARYGTNNVAYNPGYGHRVYACTIISGVPQYDWTDITDTNQYTIDLDNNIVSWTNPSDPRFMMLRDDSKFVGASISPIFINNLMEIDLTETVDRGDGSGSQDIPMEVAPSDLTMFMNTRSLVRNIDFFVEFPKVYIANYEYLNQNSNTVNQNIHWRTTGLGSGTTDLEPLLDGGLIKHGFVGTSGHYVPKNDKRYRVTIDGYLKMPNTIKFAQDNISANDDPQNVLNGYIYQVQAYNIGISDIIDTNQEPSRKLSKELDADLINYMDDNFVFPTRGAQVDQTTYTLVCPFHAKLIDDLINNVFSSSDLNPANSDAMVQATVAPYLHYLNHGPCNPVYGLINNTSYHIVPHPRNTSVSLGSSNKLTFFTRASNLNAPGVIDLSNVTL